MGFWWWWYSPFGGACPRQASKLGASATTAFWFQTPRFWKEKASFALKIETPLVKAPIAPSGVGECGPVCSTGLRGKRKRCDWSLASLGFMGQGPIE